SRHRHPHSFPTRRSSDLPKKLGLNSHCSPVTATVPSLATATAGSLSPSGRSNGVLEKLRLPDTVPAKADAPARITTSKALRINRSEEHTSELQSRSDLVC